MIVSVKGNDVLSVGWRVGAMDPALERRLRALARTHQPTNEQDFDRVNHPKYDVEMDWREKEVYGRALEAHRRAESLWHEDWVGR